MNIDQLFEFDEQDPRDRLAEYILASDEKMVADLVRLRKDRRLTQQDVADKMGIDKSGVSRIESGLRDLQLSTLRRYLMAIDAVVKHEIHGFEDVDGARKAARYFESTPFRTTPTRMAITEPARRANADRGVIVYA